MSRPAAKTQHGSRKRAAKKQRRAHKPSILHRKDGTCYLCMMLAQDYRSHEVLHEHHIFGGPNRQHSEAAGLKVYLCLRHHGPGQESVHNNITYMRLLQRAGQQAYERERSREEFMAVFGRNYLDD